MLIIYTSNEEDSDLTYEPILTLRSIRPICE